MAAKVHIRSDASLLIPAALLFIVAVALRWYRLDIMMFRYDQAEVAFRAMDAFSGNFPFTGIVNSLGFENAGGYVWTVLPAFAVSPDPRWATAWHGLLSATIVFPLMMLGKRYRSDGLAYLPAVIAAVAPVAVFGGRNLWAQHLLPALAAWGIYFLDRALRPDLDRKQKRRAAAACMGIMAWATSVHFSAGLLLLVSGLFLLVEYRRHAKTLLRVSLPAAVIILTMVPSVISYWNSRVNPEPKPDFAVMYESMLPEPFPWWVRLQDSVIFSFWNSSFDAAPGIATLLERSVSEWIGLSTAFDVIVAILVISGAVAAFFMILMQRPEGDGLKRKRLSQILLAWVFLPAVLGAVFVERVNAGYFLGSMAAVWLLPLFLPELRGKSGKVLLIFPAAVFLWGMLTTVTFITIISRKEFVPGNYYVSYGQQMELVNHLRNFEVKSGRLAHLSGGWYQHSYDYIHKFVDGRDGGQSKRGYSQTFAVVEDKNLRPDEPRRVEFFTHHNPRWFNEVGVVIFDSRGEAEIFMQQYYDTPTR